MVQNLYQHWLNSVTDPDLKRELATIKGDEREISERFSTHLAFGTAGLRGIMGAGTNRINIYTIARVTEGLVRYITQQTEQQTGTGVFVPSVVISYDTRNNSKLFADTARNVLEHFGISTYMFSEPNPVPLLSFAVRHLKADFGIMITASHNPKEYNGYKLYNKYGAQLTTEASAMIAECIDKVPFFNEYSTASPTEYIDGEINRQYNFAMNKYFHKLKQMPKLDTDIIYTSIHGCGLNPVRNLLDGFGIRYKVVNSQANFDGDFPTVLSPNPENKEALTLAIQEAQSCNAEVVVATDPDADRMAAAVRDASGDFVCLNGNDTAVLLLDYLYSMGLDGKDGIVLKSFVSTDMVDKIAAKHGSQSLEVGVGFKNIAEKMQEYESSGDKRFIFAFEESCGYLAHDLSRDKDGVSAAVLFAAMALHYKSQNKTVLERLDELHQEHGYYIDKSISAYYAGLDGFQTMQAIMRRLFETVPAAIGGKKILASRDYKSEHNSVYYELEGGSFVCVRPSGTEPKLKYYIGATAATKEDALTLFNNIKADMECLTK